MKNNNAESVLVVERAQPDALVIVASDPAIGKCSAVRVTGMGGAVRWRGSSHVTIDEEQRKMAVCGEESHLISIIYHGTSP
jgi:hypothetical protein